MSYKNLVIINNEKISKEEKSLFCDNIDIRSIPEHLNKNFDVTLIARNSKIKRKHKINLEKVDISSNIFSFIFKIFKTFKKKEVIYLIISITPYTFFSYILLFFFRKKIFVYLRSNGYEEYKEIFGFMGPLIYRLMFKTVTFDSNIISCQERLFTKRKSEIVFPSELNSLWLKNIQEHPLDKPNLLYVGRLKVEKGIFSLLKIFEEISDDIHLSIVGKKEKETLNNKNINYIGYGYEAPDLIKIYDKHNIFILPSFTEAHPKVIDESLARKRPVIIFEEIKHIIQNREGIFVSKRNAKSLVETINFIIKNYAKIQERMKKNKLPTKQEFISRMSNILSSN
jgi:glycosyltransferase involved in cell wall biosynthesis